MNECKIVEDLLPLYAENLTSEKSAAFVREHAAVCERCGKLLSRCENPEVKAAIDVKAYKKALRKNQFDLICKATLLFVVTLAVMVFACTKLEQHLLWKDGKSPVEQVIEAPTGHGKITLVDWEGSGRRIGNARNEGTLIRIAMKHFEQDEWGYGWSGSEGEMAKTWENVQAEWAPNGEEIFFMAELLDGGTGIFVRDYQYWRDDDGSHSESKLLPEGMEHGYLDILLDECEENPGFPTGWDSVEFSFYQWQDDSQTVTFVYETDNGYRGLLDFHYPSETITDIN